MLQNYTEHAQVHIIWEMHAVQHIRLELKRNLKRYTFRIYSPQSNICWLVVNICQTPNYRINNFLHLADSLDCK